LGASGLAVAGTVTLGARNRRRQRCQEFKGELDFAFLNSSRWPLIMLAA
jgi:hypothetical protein